MTELLLHPKTRLQIDDFLTSSSHAVIIEAPAGAGKSTISSFIAAELLDVKQEDLPKTMFLKIEPTENSISIDSIRGVTEFMRHKTIGNSRIRRVVVVEQAEKLTVEAQNAFLKLLEEPPADTVIILSTNNSTALLSTISSRAQQIKLLGPQAESIIDHFVKQGFDKSKINRAYHLSGGRIGLMHTILAESDDHELLKNVKSCKQLLKGTNYERLIKVNELTKDRAGVAQTLDALNILCHTGLKQSTQKGMDSQIRLWHKSLKAVVTAQEQFRYNPNLKLLMSSLLLSL